MVDMPQVSDIVKKNKFKKRPYRPWDLSAGAEKIEPAIDNPKIIQPVGTIEKTDQPIIIKEESVFLPKIRLQELDVDTGSALGIFREQLGTNKETVKEQLSNHSITVREQLDNEIGANSVKNIIRKLSGIQSKIFGLIIDISSARGELITGQVETAMIAQYVQTSIGTVKTSLNRLIQRNLINRIPGKTGKGGYINFGLSEDTMIIALEVRKEKNLRSNIHNFVSMFGQQLDNNLSTSSSSYFNKSTTTSVDLPEEWKNIDTSPVPNFGFSELKNIYRKRSENITAAIVQQSINHYGFGLKNNPGRYEKVRAHQALLVKELAEGRPWLEAHYISEDDKRRFEKEKKLVALIEKLKPEKFKEFFKEQSEEKLELWVPKEIKQQSNYKIVKKDYYFEYAEKYFNREIWPKEFQKLKEDLM